MEKPDLRLSLSLLLKFSLSRYIDRCFGPRLWSKYLLKYLLRPKFSRTNLAEVGSICTEKIASALKAKLPMSLNPLQLLTLAERKQGDYLQSYTYG